VYRANESIFRLQFLSAQRLSLTEKGIWLSSRRGVGLTASKRTSCLSRAACWVSSIRRLANFGSRGDFPRSNLRVSARRGCHVPSRSTGRKGSRLSGRSCRSPRAGIEPGIALPPFFDSRFSAPRIHRSGRVCTVPVRKVEEFKSSDKQCASISDDAVRFVLSTALSERSCPRSSRRPNAHPRD
jgi:hypothetical protein